MFPNAMLNVSVPQHLEARLRTEASSRGLPAEEYVRRILEEHLLPSPADNTGAATLRLLSQWDAEDATTDPAEIQRRQQQWEQFKHSINQNSLSDRPVYP